MDVERIQKINNLALDLMRQGLAATRDEAVAQAENIYKSNETDEYNSFKETMNEVHGSEDFKTIKESPSTNTEELSKDEIKGILQQNTSFIVKRLKEFHEKISLMEKEIESLRTKLNYRDLPTVKEIVDKKEIKVETQSQENVSAKVEEKPKQEAPHPRSGNFGEQDVSIEKFFYMGK